jgi:tRNA(fMet)-specific endonuclease VapC
MIIFDRRDDRPRYIMHFWRQPDDIRADLERKGQVIGPYDLMIAGQARSRGLVVIAGNLDEFNRVAGLRAEDWLAPPAGK